LQRTGISWPIIDSLPHDAVVARPLKRSVGLPSLNNWGMPKGNMSARVYLIKSSLIILILGVPVFTQTAADLEKKYGSPVKEYEVRPGILMTATYSDDGQVCKMYVERRHFSETSFDQRLSLPQEMIIELIEELVPTELRGGKTEGDGFSRITGQLSDRIHDYQNVSTTVLASAASGDCNGGAALIIKWKNRACKNGP
jgi:hypothetical protein